MIITWRGVSFFEILIKTPDKEKFVLEISPFDKNTGLKVPKIKSDILIVSNSTKTFLKTPDTFLIENPGEYGLKSVFIKGIPSSNNNVIYKIEAEGIRICHLGDFKQKELSSQEVEEIGEIDILMLPVGGNEIIDAKTAASIVSQIEPRIVIPMYYKIPGLKMKLDDVDAFLKLMGVEKIEPQEKLKLSVKNLPREETEIVVLKPQSREQKND